MRIIFEWPPNTSVELIRLITKNFKTKITVHKIARYNETLELGKIYHFLIKLMGYNRRNEYKMNSMHTDLEAINLETSILINRKHFNPSKMLNIKFIESIPDEMNKNGPGWFILDRASGSMAAEMMLDKVNQVIIGRHYDYQISYFNTFSLMDELARDRTINYRCLHLSESYSILKATQNLSNHDYRIIELRELMWDNGWRVNIIKKEHANIMDEYLSSIYRNLTAHRSNEPNTQSTSHAQNNENTQLISVIERPILTDYKLRDYLNICAREQEGEEFDNYHTEVTRSICNNYMTWQNLTPNWVNGRRLMALGGLCKSALNNSIEHVDGLSINCSLCSNEKSETNIIWQNISDRVINTNMVLHRMIR